MTAPSILAAGVAVPYLGEVVVLLAASLAVAYVCHRLGLPPLAGFLVAGAVAGPGGLGLVREAGPVEALAEVGVVLLLFTIGVEFKLERLARLGRLVLVGGGLQVVGTVAVVAGACLALGVGLGPAVFTGCLVALSSTTVVMALLASRGETNTPAGQASLGVLVFQDLAVVAMVLLVPMLGGAGGSGWDVARAVGEAVLIVAGVLVAARLVVPRLLGPVARTQRHELFLLLVVVLALGTAYLTGLLGVGLAMGAFLAGLVVSESPYSEHALSEVLPLRTVFNALFFVSIGLLFDARFVAAHLGLVLGVAGAVVLVKAAVAGLAVRAVGYPAGVAAAVGLGLAQVGEFSFVLERAGAEVGLTPGGLGADGGAVFVAAAVLLMLATPALLPAGQRLGRRFGARAGAAVEAAPVEAAHEFGDHVVIAGYGEAGRMLARLLRGTGVGVLAVDLDPQAAARARADGTPVLLGDATRWPLLEAAGIERAKLLAVMLDDPAAAERAVRLGHYLNPSLHVVARAGRVREAEALREAGADRVVADEAEGALRAFGLVLDAFDSDTADVRARVLALRADGYGALAHPDDGHPLPHVAADPERVHTRTVTLREGSAAVGRTLADLDLRARCGLTVLAVRRGGTSVVAPGGGFRLGVGDALDLVGPAEAFVCAAPLLRTERDRPDGTAPEAPQAMSEPSRAGQEAP
jgi:CPA2 family monovalent cation:H+ antiporter-2